MELKAEIQESVKIAMKSGDSLTLSTLRLLLAAIQNEEIRARKKLTEEELQRIIASLCKQRNEAIGLYRRGGREELAQKEESELAVLRRYLPQPMADEELKALIRGCIDQAGAKGVQDAGRVMKLIMPRVAGRSDGKRVNEFVKMLLQE